MIRHVHLWSVTEQYVSIKRYIWSFQISRLVMSIYGDPIDPRRVFCSSPYIEFVHFLRSPYIWAQNGPDEDPQVRNVVSRIKRSTYGHKMDTDRNLHICKSWLNIQ